MEAERPHLQRATPRSSHWLSISTCLPLESTISKGPVTIIGPSWMRTISVFLVLFLEFMLGIVVWIYGDMVSRKRGHPLNPILK